MGRKFYHPIILILVSLPFVFMGCSSGGGSDGGSDGGDGSSGLSYTGLTTPAQVDEDNAIELAASAFAAGQAGTVMAASETSQDYQEATDLQIDNFRVLNLPWILGNASRSIDLSPPLYQLSLNAEAVYTEKGTLDGPCGGTVTYTLNIDDITGEFDGTFVFSNYCDSGVIINGDTDVEGTADLGTGDIITITFWFDNLSDGTMTVDGEISIDYSDSPILCTMEGLLEDKTTQKVYWAKNYSLNIYEYAGYIEVEIFGTFYHPDYGYVTVSTEESFVIYDGDEWPSSGILLMVGANNTKAKLTAIDETKCRIVADTDGDGVYDYDSGNLYWTDFNQFFTEVGGIIDADTIWDLAGSPYKITSIVQIAEGATLTIEPGVVVNGGSTGNPDFYVWGNINATGSESSKIFFNNVSRIDFQTTQTLEPSVIFQFVHFSENRSNAGIQGPGAITIRDSEIHSDGEFLINPYGQYDLSIERNIFTNESNSYYIYLKSYSGTSYVEQNIFQNTRIEVASSISFERYLRNNVLYGTSEIFTQFTTTEDMVIEYNSFLNTDRIVLRLLDNDSSMIAINNYWNTTDIGIINSMIYDRNDDLTIGGYIEYLPILTQPHPDTPPYP